jgi:hypothetical protein
MIWVVQGIENMCEKNGLIRDLAVDHDHKTGRVRGLLCRRCKQAMGLLNEDRNLLQQMIDYLSSFDSDLDISSLPWVPIKISHNVYKKFSNGEMQSCKMNKRHLR